MSSPHSFLESRTIKVFISSTFQDMMDERHHLVTQIFPRLRQKARARGVEIHEVDLRWGITEEESEDGKTVALCLEQIDACRPFFLGLVGDRYGWIPKTEPEEKKEKLFEHLKGSKYEWVIEEVEKGYSITAIEFMYGALNKKLEEGMAFFLEKNPQKNLLSRIGKPKDKNIKQFKQLIKEKGYELNPYKSIEDLGEKVEQEILTFLDQTFPLSFLPDDFQRIKKGHEDFLTARTRAYIARQVYFDNITNHVVSKTEPLVITAEPGMGKTSLIANWMSDYRKKHPDSFTFIHFCGSTPDSSNPYDLLKRLFHELKKNLGLEKDLPDSDIELTDHLMVFLEQAEQSGKQITIAIDALNQLDNSERTQNLGWLRLADIKNRRFQNIDFILSTTPGRSFDALQEIDLPVMYIDPLTEAEKVFMSKEYLAQFGKSLQEHQLKKIVEAQQTQNPFYLKTLLDQIRLFGVVKGLAEVGQSEHIDALMSTYLDCSDTKDLIASIAKKLEDIRFAEPKGNLLNLFKIAGKQKISTHENIPPSQRLLYCLCLSYKGMPEVDLLQIGQFTPLQLTSMLALTEFLWVKKNELVFFQHAYGKEAIEILYANTPNSHQIREHFKEYYTSRLEESSLEFPDMQAAIELAHFYLSFEDEMACGNLFLHKNFFIPLFKSKSAEKKLINRLFAKAKDQIHADQIGKELLSPKKPKNQEDYPILVFLEMLLEQLGEINLAQEIVTAIYNSTEFKSLQKDLSFVLGLYEVTAKIYLSRTSVIMVYSHEREPILPTHELNDFIERIEDIFNRVKDLNAVEENFQTLKNLLFWSCQLDIKGKRVSRLHHLTTPHYLQAVDITLQLGLNGNDYLPFSSANHVADFFRDLRKLELSLEEKVNHFQRVFDFFVPQLELLISSNRGDKNTKVELLTNAATSVFEFLYKPLPILEEEFSLLEARAFIAECLQKCNDILENYIEPYTPKILQNKLLTVQLALETNDQNKATQIKNELKISWNYFHSYLANQHSGKELVSGLIGFRRLLYYDVIPMSSIKDIFEPLLHKSLLDFGEYSIITLNVYKTVAFIVDPNNKDYFNRRESVDYDFSVEVLQKSIELNTFHLGKDHNETISLMEGLLQLYFVMFKKLVLQKPQIAHEFELWISLIKTYKWKCEQYAQEGKYYSRANLLNYIYLSGGRMSSFISAKLIDDTDELEKFTSDLSVSSNQTLLMAAPWRVGESHEKFNDYSHQIRIDLFDEYIKIISTAEKNASRKQA